jgi:hypothetical protein
MPDPYAGLLKVAKPGSLLGFHYIDPANFDPSRHVLFDNAPAATVVTGNEFVLPPAAKPRGRPRKIAE